MKATVLDFLEWWLGALGSLIEAVLTIAWASFMAAITVAMPFVVGLVAYWLASKFLGLNASVCLGILSGFFVAICEIGWMKEM